MFRLSRVFAGFTALFLALALLFGGVVPYYILYILISVLVLSVLYTVLVGSGIGFSIKASRNICTCGETVACELKILNAVSLPVPYAQVHSAAEEFGQRAYKGSFFSMSASEDNWRTVRLRFASRGIYPLGKLTVTVWDLFRIVRYQKTIDAGLSIKVYPRLYPITGLFPGASDIYRDTYASHGQNENQYTMQDIRAYREGDSLKRVHWKASAKRGELYVKNYEKVTGTETALFIDMHKDNYGYGEDAEERIVDTALSIVKGMLARHVEMHVYINAARSMHFMVHSPQAFEALMEHCLTQRSDGTMDFLEFLQRYYYQIPHTSAITIVLAAVTERVVHNILGVRKSGYTVHVIYCAASDPALIRELHRWGVSCSGAEDLFAASEPVAL
jgi:uncharacterized protein (DUF58 family)